MDAELHTKIAALCERFRLEVLTLVAEHEASVAAREATQSAAEAERNAVLFYTDEAAAELLGISKYTLQHLHRLKKIGYVRITARKKGTTPEQIKEYLERNRTPREAVAEERHHQMSSDETERQMEFIIEQQARSEARISRLERVMKLAIRAGLRERRDTRHNINALINAQLHTDEAMAKLAEAQAHTDARLSALIDVVGGSQ